MPSPNVIPMFPKPEDCPRFSGCSANICPMDADWRKRSPEGSPTCLYLLESVKPTANEVVPSEILPICLEFMKQADLPSQVRIPVEQSRKFPSRVLEGRRKMARVKAVCTGKRKQKAS